MKKPEKYHFIGIGGTGMSSLACLLAKTGTTVSGSDRLLDGGKDTELFEKMRAFGIRLFPQDGSGLEERPDAVVASPAVESSNPDLAGARRLKLRVMTRAELLIGLTRGKKTIGIAGTSGKSTITTMIAHIMTQAGRSPTVVVGARMKNYETPADPGCSLLGRSPWFCMEVDESDGWISKYRCHTALLSNIEKDHKEVAELKRLFAAFLSKTTDTIIVNADSPPAAAAAPPGRKVISYALRAKAALRPTDVTMSAGGSLFTLRGQLFRIRQQGAHNVSNALAAIAVSRSAGIPLKSIADALDTYTGLGRRMEVIGMAGGITVIDDFAHNPSKIQAALDAARLLGKRRIIIYQPHGYGPTLFLRRGLVEAFSRGLSIRDHLFILDIYYAGGTARKEITSDDLAAEIAQKLPNTAKPSSREELVRRISEIAEDGDVVIVMGARDRSLNALAKAIYIKLKANRRGAENAE